MIKKISKKRPVGNEAYEWINFGDNRWGNPNSTTKTINYNNSGFITPGTLGGENSNPGVTSLSVKGQPLLTKDVYLYAGSNIGLVQSSDTITIAANIAKINLLDGDYHQDTTAGSPTSGYIVYGSGTKWESKKAIDYFVDLTSLQYIHGEKHLYHTLSLGGKDSGDVEHTGILNFYNSSYTGIYTQIASGAAASTYSMHLPAAIGSAAQVLGIDSISGGNTAILKFIDQATSLPKCAKGDLLVGTGTDAWGNINIGTKGYVLTSDGVTCNWALAGSGSYVTLTGDQDVDGKKTFLQNITLKDTGYKLQFTDSSDVALGSVYAYSSDLYVTNYTDTKSILFYTQSGVFPIETLKLTGQHAYIQIYLDVDKQLTVGKASTRDGILSFKNATNNNTISFTSGVTGADLSFILPTAYGTKGYALVDTDGAGTLGWAAISGGGGSTTKITYGATAGYEVYVDTNETAKRLIMQAGEYSTNDIGIDMYLRSTSVSKFKVASFYTSSAVPYIDFITTDIKHYNDSTDKNTGGYYKIMRSYSDAYERVGGFRIYPNDADITHYGGFDYENAIDTGDGPAVHFIHNAISEPRIKFKIYNQYKTTTQFLAYCLGYDYTLNSYKNTAGSFLITSGNIHADAGIYVCQQLDGVSTNKTYLTNITLSTTAALLTFDATGHCTSHKGLNVAVITGATAGKTTGTVTATGGIVTGLT